MTKNKFLTLLCAGALVLSSSAGAVGPREVRAVHWTDPIYVDGVTVGFQNEQGDMVNALAYNGTIYIPIRSAGEWMGCTVGWDQASQAIRLSSGKTPVVVSAADTPSLSTEALNTFIKEKESGISITLRPDLTVTLDGKEQRFQNEKGEPVYPVMFKNVTYLPARSVGELCGLETAFVPKSTPDSYQWIILYTLLTDQQKAAVSTYLATVENAFEQFRAALTEYTAQLDTMTPETAIAQLDTLTGYLQKITKATVDVPAMEQARWRISMTASGAITSGVVGSDRHLLEQGKTMAELRALRAAYVQNVLNTGGTDRYQDELNTLEGAMENLRHMVEALGITA